MNQRFFQIICCLSFVAGSVHAECPEWSNRPELVPACPDHGFLGDEFPALAHVLSTEEAKDPILRKAQLGRVEETVRKLFVYSAKRPPLVYLNTSQAEFEAVRASLLKLEIPPATRQNYVDNLRWVDSTKVTASTWVQDRFQAFNNPATGNATLRLGEGYADRQATQNLLQAMRDSCRKIEVGEVLKKHGECTSTECGGNIEFVPRAGLCFVGNNQPKPFTRQYCKDSEELVMPSDFLRVGHVDEVLSAHSVPGTKCDIVLAHASYPKALALLESSPESPLFENAFPENLREVKEEERLRTRSEALMGSRKPFSTFCEYYKGKRGPSQIGSVATPPQNGRDRSAHGPASGSLYTNRPVSEQKVTNELCLKARVKDFLEFLKDPAASDSLHERNLEIQKNGEAALANLRRTVQTKLGSECKVHVVEVPQILNSAINADSFFPNPTNNIPIEGTLLIPHPQNQIFREYLAKAFKEKGLGTSFIPTADDLHSNQGNLHCAINTIRTCTGTGKSLATEFAMPATPADLPREILPTDEKLIAHLLSGSDKIKEATLEKLGKSLQNSPLKDDALRKRLIPVVARLLATKSPDSAYDATRVLLALGPEAVPEIQSAFHNAPPETQAGMLHALWSRPKFAERLGDMVREGLRSPDPRVVAKAIPAVKDNGVADVNLLPFLKHPSAEVRRYTIYALSDAKQLTGNQVSIALDDVDPEVRQAAAERIKSIAAEQVPPLVQKILTSRDPELHFYGYLNAPKFLENASALLESTKHTTAPENLRGFLHGAIQAKKTNLVVDALAAQFSDPRPETLERVLKYLEDFDVEPRSLFADAYARSTPLGKRRLIEIGSHKISHPLRAALRDSDPKLADQAMKKLDQLVNGEDVHLRLFSPADEPILRAVGKRIQLPDARLKAILDQQAAQ